MMHAERRERLIDELKARGLDAVVVSKPVNVTYLTGFTGEASYLVMAPNRALLISDGRFTEQIAEECPGLEVHIRPPTITTPPVVAQVVGQLGYRNVGIDANHVTVALLETWKEQAPAVTWTATTRLVETLRMIKDADEVRQIRAAVAVAERAFAMFRATLRGGASEDELCAALEQYIRMAGGRATSFPSIVAVGPRSALAHAPPTERTVASSDFLLVDWGARGSLYCSDLTRMLVTRTSWFRSGPPRADDAFAELERVYDAVLAAQERALAAIRPGVAARDVDAAARAALAERGLADAFTHGLGHGLGLEVHEAPDLRASSNDVLQPGMVITIEPGAYRPGWGGVRIEDDVLVTPDGYERLSTLPRDFAAARV